MKLSTADYQALSRPRYGAADPERIENELWEHIIRNGLGGYSVRKAFGDTRWPDPRSDATSAYREQENGPVWSWDRMGRTSTTLPDGRVVHVAGEHEDFYDPDFCIFNDVVVEHPDGRIEIYGYPKEVFPPTDFHTATLVDGAIILIGSVGYRDLRRPGDCQVFRLDTTTWRMEKVAVTGEGPGWIAHHAAEYDGGETILVLGGRIERTAGGNGAAPATEIVRNDQLYALNLNTFAWQPVAHGDERFFAVSMEDYRKGRNPRIGTANPERVENPFWREMLRRNWGPGRARLHFGDWPPQRPNDPQVVHGKRPIDEVVWTAVREGAAELALEDGRKLTIGGEFSDFGGEWADRWNYNDIIVTHPDGAIEILAYPVDALPPLYGPWATLRGDRILVFGNVSRYEPGPRRAAAIALDSVTLEASLLDTVCTQPAVLTYIGPCRADDEQLVFAIVKRTREEEPRYVSFDLKTLKWRQDG
jgi:hypothetical protein